MAQSYSSYLKVDELLALQQARSEGPEHDELLFIVIHQVYELWFKQILHEADFLSAALTKGSGIRASQTLDRILKIFGVLIHQIEVLETMTPLEFLSFRARLDSASGFQSHQFREVEVMLGVREPEKLSHFVSGTPAHDKIQTRLAAPSLWQCFLTFLRGRGHEVPEVQSNHDVPAKLSEVLIDVYRNDHEAAALAERMVDLDAALQDWRYRHVKMVQRTIGSKRGTGGSAGVEYLISTLMKPAFPALWGIRTQF
jgi:tryptophan 2,3-dioxygenase